MENELIIEKPKWLGLMFEFRKDKMEKIVVTEHDKLHTFFCRTLDMWFYDMNNKLISTKYSIKPFTIVELPKNTKYVIERTI